MNTFGRQVRATTDANEATTRPGTQAIRPGRFVRPMTRRRSDFITTRCYSPTGVQIWDADHGADVYALAVDHLGYVYQCGKKNNYDLGPSLFHEISESAFDRVFPQVTGLAPGGAPLWANLLNAASADWCQGICVTPSRDLYYGVIMGQPDGAVIRKATHRGVFVTNLTSDGFFHGFDPAGTPAWGTVQRVRNDADGNIYANVGFGYYNNLGTTVFKWEEDVFGWRFQWVDYRAYAGNGLSVANNGRYACAGGGTDPISPNPHRTLTIAGEKLDSPLPGDNELFARILPPVLGVQDACYGVASSPSGRVVAKRLDDTVIEVTPTGSYTTPPTVTTRATVPGLICITGTAVSFPTEAVGINDSGQIVYSVERTTTGNSHEIRDAANTLILAADHGGNIHDAVVLPDGKVIVAGERVPR